MTIAPKYYKEVCKEPKKAVRKYLDLLRKTTNGGKYLRHWFITEHGSDEDYVDEKGRKRKGSKRLHFHGIIFGVTKDDVPFNSLHKK